MAAKKESGAGGDAEMQQSEGNIMEVSGAGRKSGRRNTNMAFQGLMEDDQFNNPINSSFKKLDFLNVRSGDNPDKVRLFASNTDDGEHQLAGRKRARG